MASSSGTAGSGTSLPKEASSPPARDQVDAFMLAARALVGVAAQGVSEVEDRVTLPQLRVLMLTAAGDGLNLASLAQAMSVHPSNASRACDRLVEAGLLNRKESSIDRRNLVLELTREGEQLIKDVIDRRRSTIEGILARVPEGRRRNLISAMRAFALAAGEEESNVAWRLGWHS